MDKLDTLTAEQKQVLTTVSEGHTVFMTGCGGSGKSYLIDVITEVIGKTKSVHVTALTACAALLLGPTAKTLHSWAGIGLGKDSVSELLFRINRNGRAKKNWRNTDLLIIDEISMLTADLFDKLDDLGQRMRRSSKPFGGLQLLLVGDFCQLPPVVRDGISRFTFQSDRWPTIVNKTIQLTQIQRQKDPVFQKILGEARRGSLSPESETLLRSRMGLDWKSLKIRPTLLFPKNDIVDKCNEANLRALKGEKRVFKVRTLNPITKEHNPEYLKALELLDREGGYKPELELAIGAQVMCIQNLNMEKGIVNGSRGVVVGFDEEKSAPIVEFISGHQETMVPHAWAVEGFEGVFRQQIPLRLAWACTIHKAQGATLDSALIDIGPSTFECGQAYVALSRVKSLESLYVHDFSADAFRLHPAVKLYYGV